MTKTFYSDTFSRAFAELVLLEGDYSNDKYDNGGETRFGISKRIYSNLDIKSLTIEKAKDIYYKDYWSAYNYDKIYHSEVASKIFHTTVNTGAKQSHIILQRALRSVGMRIVEDGIFGSETLKAVNKAPSKPLLAALRSELAGFYRLIITKNPSQIKFQKGWLNRAYN